MALTSIVVILLFCSALADHPRRLLNTKYNYVFDVATDLSVDNYQGDESDGPEVTVRARASIEPVASPDLWAITLSAIKVEATGKKTEVLDKSEPVFVQYDETNGQISHFYRKEHSHEGFTSNLIKSIANLLGSKRESFGLFGPCTIESFDETDGHVITTYTNCESDKELNKRSNHPLGIAANVQRQTVYKYNSDKDVEAASTLDVIDYYVSGNKEIKSKVESTLRLKFVSKQSKTSKDVSTKDFIKNLIQSDNKLFTFPRCDDSHCSKLSDFIEFRKDDFEKSNIGTDKLALTTLTTVLNIKAPAAKDIEKILASKKTKSIRGQILDVLAALQTWETYSGVMSSLFDKEDSVDDLERYLQTLSVGSSPQKTVIEDIIKRLSNGKVKNEKVKSTLIQAVSSMVYNYAQTTNFDIDVVDSVDTFLWDQFLKCKEIECSAQYLRGYLNLKLVNKIPDLLVVVQKQPKVLGTIAMKALQHFSLDSFSTRSQQILKSIFHQTVRKYDSSIRTLALDILIKGRLSVEDIADLFQALKQQDKYFEVKQYLLEQFKLRSSECEEFRRMINEVLSSDSDLNNYHRIATGGLTTALSRQFLSYPSFNSSIISVQEIQKGVLKRGFVDFAFNTDEDKFSYFTLEIYARGLSSMMGGADKEDENAEEESLTAGMELIVNGQSLRPLEFFNGQGELMGHVWSGTASDPTPAYQATSLFFDHRFEVPLQSGFAVQFDLMTAISIDLNGQVSLSLWNRNGKSKVEQSIGLATVGRTTVITDYSRTTSEYRLLQNPKLNLISDFEFSGNNLLCLQLSQPDITLRKTYWKKNVIPSLKVSDEKEKNHFYQIAGNSHLLNAKNNEMCRSIHNEL